MRFFIMVLAQKLPSETAILATIEPEPPFGTRCGRCVMVEIEMRRPHRNKRLFARRGQPVH